MHRHLHRARLHPGLRPVFGPETESFGYILNGETGFNPESNPAALILCSPLAMDGKTVSPTRFDPDIYDGRVILLRVDLSAFVAHASNTTGELTHDENPWLTPGENTIWGTHTPRVATPLPQ